MKSLKQQYLEMFELYVATGSETHDRFGICNWIYFKGLRSVCDLVSPFVVCVYIGEYKNGKACDDVVRGWTPERQRFAENMVELLSMDNVFVDDYSHRIKLHPGSSVEEKRHYQNLRRRLRRIGGYKN